MRIVIGRPSLRRTVQLLLLMRQYVIIEVLYLLFPHVTMWFRLCHQPKYQSLGCRALVFRLLLVLLTD